MFCGFDSYFPEVVRGGGDGAIGGLSNIFPELAREWVQAFERDDDAEVERISLSLIHI